MLKDTVKTLHEIGVAPGDCILVAVSGGADSVALLHLLHNLASEYPFSLRVAHIDHALRDESEADASFVADLCFRLGVPLDSERIDVAAVAKQRKMGVEEAAREVRLAFLGRIADTNSCHWIALGHHRGDQAETILHRMIRGAALPGLAGMHLRRGRIIRPFLKFSRVQIRGYLSANGLQWVEDLSNSDFRYTRNRIRHQILPILKEINPCIEEHLFRIGRRVAIEEDFWQDEEARALSRVRQDEAGEMLLDCAGLMELHPALRVRVLRRAIEEVRGNLLGIAAAHLESLEHLLAGERPQAEAHLPGLWAARRYGKLRMLKAFPPPPGNFHMLLPTTGTYELPDSSRLVLEISETFRGENEGSVEFDADAVGFPLSVRTFVPGDRFRPDGAPGRKKLKDFFIDQKIDLETRRSVPVVDGDEILWIVGVRRCHGRRPRYGGRVLRISVSPPKV